MAEAPPDLVLDSLRGEGYALRDWLTSYPLLLVALDPYTHESAWIRAGRRSTPSARTASRSG
ncbi:MAG: hypothetical protein AAFN30_04900, partial [Actinomycetota bacterium]